MIEKTNYQFEKYIESAFFVTFNCNVASLRSFTLILFCVSFLGNKSSDYLNYSICIDHLAALNCLQMSIKWASKLTRTLEDDPPAGQAELFAQCPS